MLDFWRSKVIRGYICKVTIHFVGSLYSRNFGQCEKDIRDNKQVLYNSVLFNFSPKIPKYKTKRPPVPKKNPANIEKSLINGTTRAKFPFYSKHSLRLIMKELTENALQLSSSVGKQVG